MNDVLHEDDDTAEVTLEDGRVVRNLSAEEYAATYVDGTPHNVYLPDTDETGVVS